MASSSGCLDEEPPENADASSNETSDEAINKDALETGNVKVEILRKIKHASNSKQSNRIQNTAAGISIEMERKLKLFEKREQSSNQQLSWRDSNYGRTEKNRLEGYWGLTCDDEIKDRNGLTESDKVWKSLNELYQDKSELFIKPPQKRASYKPNLKYVVCFTENYTDKTHVAKVAKLISQKTPNYQFPLTYRMKKTVYMYTMDGDLYETFDQKGWKLAQF